MPENKVIELRKLYQMHAFSTIQMHEAIGRKTGLSGTDHKYLGFIVQKGQMTAGELATLTGLTTGAVTGLIDRFEKKNLVFRKFDQKDRRKVYIVPRSEQITALLEPLYKDFMSETEKFLAQFSTEEARVIGRYLEKSIEVMMKTTSEFNQK